MLKIRALGTLAISLNDKALANLPSRKADALLLYLACNQRPHARERLADLLWDDRPLDQALANLRSVLSSLRRQLKPYLIVTRQTVAFNTDADYWLDSEQVTALLSPAPEQGVLTADGVATLEAGLAPDHGLFLSSLMVRESRGFDEWVMVEQERLRRLVARARYRLTIHYGETGRYPQALTHAQRLITLDPLSEAAHYQLMLTHARLGQLPEAATQFGRLKQQLADSLNMTPARETIALYNRIVAAARRPPESPPWSQEPLIGRANVLTELRTYLINNDCRLVTILGPGGVGKTHLAQVSIASLLYDSPYHFLNGVTSVTTTSIQGLQQFAAALADAVDMGSFAMGQLQHSLISFLREKEMLILLDNFERLLEGEHGADIVSLLDQLLTQAPGIKLIVTSRERLQLRQEWLLDLQGLPFPDDLEQLPNDPTAAERLFQSAAEQIDGRFQLTPENRGSIATICQLVSGIPLGIILAAASLNDRSAAEIAAGLRATFDSLASAEQLPSRHQSLRATFDHSWQRLTEDERQAATALAILETAFTRPTAAAVAQAHLPILMSLRDKSILYQPKHSASKAQRFAMHNILRHFALERLGQQPGRENQIRQQHATYFLSWIASQTEAIGKGHAETVALMRREIENMIIAWHWAVENADVASIEAAFLGISHYMQLRGWLTEGFELLQIGIDMLSKQPVPPMTLHAQLIERQAALTVAQSSYVLTHHLLDEAIPLLQEAKRNQPVCWAIITRGTVHYYQGNYQQAETDLRAGLTIARRNEDDLTVAHALNSLGSVICDSSADYEQARQYYEESLALYEKHGHENGRVRALINIGGVAQSQAAFERATALYEQSIQLARRLDNRPVLAIAINNLGHIKGEQANYDEAEKLLRESLAIKRDCGLQRSSVYTLNQLGQITLQQGELPLSKSYFDEALLIGQTVHSPVLLAFVLSNAAHLLQRCGALELAVQTLAVIEITVADDLEIRAATQAVMSDIESQLAPSTVAQWQQEARAYSLASVVNSFIRFVVPHSDQAKRQSSLEHS